MTKRRFRKREKEGRGENLFLKKECIEFFLPLRCFAFVVVI